MRVLRAVGLLAVVAGLMGAIPTAGDNMYVIEGRCDFKARAVRVVDTIRPNGGFGGHGVLTAVGALPEFEMVGSHTVKAKPGQKIDLRFKAGSYQDCGELNLNFISFNFTPTGEGPQPWVEGIVKDKIPGTVTIDGYAYSAPPNTMTNVQVFYTFRDKTPEAWQTHIPTVEVKPGKDIDVVFMWMVPKDAPVGSTFSLHLSTIGWTDRKTSQYVVPDESWYDDIYVNVTVEPPAS